MAKVKTGLFWCCFDVCVYVTPPPTHPVGLYCKVAVFRITFWHPPAPCNETAHRRGIYHINMPMRQPPPTRLQHVHLARVRFVNPFLPCPQSKCCFASFDACLVAYLLPLLLRFVVWSSLPPLSTCDERERESGQRFACRVVSTRTCRAVLCWVVWCVPHVVLCAHIATPPNLTRRLDLVARRVY